MQPSFLRGMRQDIHKKEYKKRNRINSFFKRAGDGNRTHVISLGSWSSAIELHPQQVWNSTIKACRRSSGGMRRTLPLSGGSARG